MKKLMLLLTLITLPFLGFAQKNKAGAPKNKKCIEAQVTCNDVKMYRQAGTSSEIIASLNTTDEVLYHHTINGHWAVVSVGDKAGYVLFSELTNRKAQSPAGPAVALAKKRK